MSLDINLTGVEKTSNKKTTLTDNSDTFYPSQKAVKTAVDLKVDVVAGKGLSENDFTNTLKTKLDGIQAGAEVNVNADWNATSGDAQILNKPTIPDTSDFVEKSDFTSHSILAKQSGASDPVAVSIGNNEILGRKSGGGSNIEGLSVSEVKSILNYTASDVGAPSGSGTSSGTNTGDETQSTILSKLGFFISKTTTPSSNVTGITETIVNSIAIGGNRLASSDKLIIDSDFVKTTTLGQYALRYYLAPNSNNLTGAVQIAVASAIGLTTAYIPSFFRSFTIHGGNLKGFPFTQSVIVPAATVNAMSTTAFNVANTFYLITTITLNNGLDSAYLNSQTIKNF
jgi:hypothetical protein